MEGRRKGSERMRKGSERRREEGGELKGGGGHGDDTITGDPERMYQATHSCDYLTVDINT